MSYPIWWRLQGYKLVKLNRLKFWNEQIERHVEVCEDWGAEPRASSERSVNLVLNCLSTTCYRDPPTSSSVYISVWLLSLRMIICSMTISSYFEREWSILCSIVCLQLTTEMLLHHDSIIIEPRWPVVQYKGKLVTPNSRCDFYLFSISSFMESRTIHKKFHAGVYFSNQWFIFKY